MVNHMNKKSPSNVTRRDVLKIGAATGAATAIGAIAGRPTPAAAQTVGATCTGLPALEAFPTSPLILNPFTDPLPIPKAAAPVPPSTVATWTNRPGSGVGQQDADGGTHQLWTSQLGLPDPIVYNFKLQVAAHSFSSSPVRTLVAYTDANGNIVPAGTVVPKLPDSTVYGFNGTFPGPRINAEYGKPVLVRFENHLDENPLNLDRQDFGDPGLRFLTHLHNGHTAAESDGNPHHRIEAYAPGQWVDDLYLNYPPDGDDREKQSFLWFHDHREGHTGANVYKGMVGLFPIYDPKNGMDMGDETKGLRLPGVRTDNPDGTFDVEYDIPLALYDCALDDGVVPHQDFHNGCGEAHPEWWGKTFFRHFPNHGFIGDVFTVNCKAYPVLEVKRRKYRLRFLGASIARCYELQLMRSAGGPKSALSLGLVGAELQGQYRIPDGQQCMKLTQIASEGGLLPKPIVRDSFEIWPANRREFVVDFSKYQDGSPTKPGDVIYLTNIMKMTDGRKPTSGTRFGLDKAYKVPMMKIVIGDVAPDNSIMPTAKTVLREAPPVPPNWQTTVPRRTFELQRGGFGGETQWLINGHPFDPTVPLAEVKKGTGEVWILRNGGAGWTHPMHLHQEEHRVLQRNKKTAPDAAHPDDTGKYDVVDLDPGEEVWVYRKFRTFTGKYVAHCHNLAHEDHAMMFGWKIIP
jgi:FtsP/CotA-like multicopper oxidase with cupredoxin domain